MARPRIEIDWDQLDKLCALQCTKDEIAEWFDCSDDTISRSIKREFKMSFADYYKKKSSRGKISLRRYQFDLAQRNVAMAIWLGKQYLGQRDEPLEDMGELPSGFDLAEI